MADEARVPLPHQEWDASEHCLIGRDPRKMTEVELAACGIMPQPLLAVIRAKCLDCVCYQPSEVRRCGDIKCPNWPYRMNANPFRRQDLTEEQRAKRRGRLEQARAANSPQNSRHENPEEASQEGG
jgi:hypothetical protein